MVGFFGLYALAVAIVGAIIMLKNMNNDSKPFHESKKCGKGADGFATYISNHFGFIECYDRERHQEKLNGLSSYEYSRAKAA